MTQRRYYTWSGGREEASSARFRRFVVEYWQHVVTLLAFFGFGTLSSLFDPVNALVWSKGKLILEIGSLAGAGFFIAIWSRVETRRLKLEKSFHDFVHHTRDDVLEFLESDGSHFRLPFTQAINRIAELFKVAFRSHEVQGLVTVASAAEDGATTYEPLAWTSGFDHEHCCSFDSRGKFVTKLREVYKLRGVILIPDASKLRDDEDFSDLQESVGKLGCAVIVPVNTWVNQKKELAGLLILTGRTGLFHLRHIGLLMACADVLGMAFALALTSDESGATSGTD